MTATKLNDLCATILLPFAADPDGYLVDGVIDARDMPARDAQILANNGVVEIVNGRLGYEGVRLTAIGEAFFDEVAAEG